MTMASGRQRESSKSLYRYLESAFDSGEFVGRGAGVVVPAGEIRHSIDPGGKRILLVPLSEDEYASFLDDSAGNSVSLKKERYASPIGAIEPYLVFRCESVSLNNTFAAFVDDVLDEFEGTSEGASPTATARIVLEKWRRLFATHGPGLMGDKQIVGLAAELRLLRHLVDMFGVGSFDAWIGPDGADHDFVLPGFSIEVKATMRKSGMEIEINGLGQLTPPAQTPLYLSTSRFAFSPNGATCLPELVEMLLESGVDRDEFARKLAAVGYHHSRADEYGAKRMDILEDRYFEIVSEFPRIDRSTLDGVPQADRIRQISYLLDLTSHESVPGSLAAKDPGTFLEAIS